MSAILFGLSGSIGIALGACVSGPVLQPVADGVFNEYAPTDLIATDPSGDASGAFDVTELWARSEGTVLILRFTTAPVGGTELNVQSGSAGDGTLVVRMEIGNGDSLSVDLRARRLFQNDNTGNVVSWSAAGYYTAPTHSAREFELRADLSVIGASVGEQLLISFSGSDVLASSASFTMSGPAVVPVRRDVSRGAGATFRIASLNTRVNGLINSSRGPRLARVIDALDAEIYCFQEEGASSEAQIEAILNSADPLETGANWVAHKNNDQFVAVDSSIGTLIPVPENDNNYSSAVIDFGGGEAVIVFSIHPKCCGFIGSTEDQQRIDQMGLLISTLNQFRAGQLGGALTPFASAPAVVTGDWNLVGSRVPLDLLEDPAGPAMQTETLRSLIGDETITWIGGSQGAGSFAPGRLDLVSHDTALNSVKSFLFDSRLLTSGELSALGLQQSDSGASDHLTLVVDFGPAGPVICNGDANGDGIVNFADITDVLANWLTAGPAGDANGDGTVNFADITDVLANWLATCV